MWHLNAKFGFPRVQRSDWLTTCISFQKNSLQQWYIKILKVFYIFINYKFWLISRQGVVKWTISFLAMNHPDVLMIQICNSFPGLLYFFCRSIICINNKNNITELTDVNGDGSHNSQHETANSRTWRDGEGQETTKVSVSSSSCWKWKYDIVYKAVFPKMLSSCTSRCRTIATSTPNAWKTGSYLKIGKG